MKCAKDRCSSVKGDEIDSIVNGKEGNEWARKPLILKGMRTAGFSLSVVESNLSLEDQLKAKF